MREKINVCYLCGQNLKVSEISNDHVPPRQFYASGIRKNNLNLFTLPVHFACNKAYQKDEDYFVHSLAPLAKGTYAGSEVMKDISKQFKRQEGQKIGSMILKEFEKTPSGIILPNGLVAKRFKRERIERITWKLTRGLYFKEKDVFLPEDTKHYFKLETLDSDEPFEYRFIQSQPGKGDYPTVFDYKYNEIKYENNYVNVLGISLWQKFVLIVVFLTQIK